MITFTLAGHSYRADMMPARTQLHVSRRLGPLLVGMKDVVPKMLTARKTADVVADAKLGMSPEFQGLDVMLDDFKPFLEILADMPDEKVDYLIDAALSTVKRAMPNDTGWTSVWADGQILFTDITMPMMLNITGRVLFGNLRGFIPGTLSTSIGQ